MSNIENDKNSYRCRVKTDCSKQFLHTISTFILGSLINFRHLIYFGLWYIILFTPVLNKPMGIFPIWLYSIIAILLLCLCIYCIFFKIAPGIFKNITTWVKIFIVRRKLPLMKIGYPKAKVFISNLDNFTCGEIYIGRNTAYTDYCWDNSYYGVNEFLGFYQDKNTAFKGSIFSTIMIIYSISITEFKESFLKFLEKHAIEIESSKKERRIFKEDLNKNEQKAIRALLKEIEKKKKQSEEEINQAVDGMNDILDN